MPKKPDTIRASEADIVLQCGKAAQPPEHAIDISGPEALIGRAAHDAIEHWINDGMPEDGPKPQPAANQHGIDPREIEDTIAAAPAMLGHVREDLLGLKAEVDVLGGGVRGRIDALSLRMAGARLFGAAVLDWKTGRDPMAGGKPGQRLAYASAVEAQYGMPAQAYIYTAEMWLATGDIIESRLDKDSIAGFRRRIAENIERGTASPGGHCKYCRRRHECEERDLYLRSSASALTAVKSGAMPAEAIASLWEQSRSLKRALKDYERAVDIAIDEHGALELGDGRRIVHLEKTTQTIDARKAWPAMMAGGLSDSEINEALRVSKRDLMAIVNRKATRGKKEEAKKSMAQRLDDCGAVVRKRTKYRRVVAD